MRSTTRAPRCRAPRARAAVRSVGLALPSPGSQIAPCEVVHPEDAGSAPAPPRGESKVALEVEGSRRRRRTTQLGHPVLGARDRQAAALLVAGGEPDLVLEPGVELGGVLHQPGAALVRAQLADQPGRVPRRTRRELALLEQHHVGPAELREVVGDAGADDATADDDDLRAVRQLGGHVSRPSWPARAGSRTPGSSNSATARSYFSIAHSQKSKSIELTELWIEPQRVQPYFDISPHNLARATRCRSSCPSYASISSSSCSAVRLASLQRLPSSKHGSLLPAYS